MSSCNYTVSSLLFNYREKYIEKIAIFYDNYIYFAHHHVLLM